MNTFATVLSFSFLFSSRVSNQLFIVSQTYASDICSATTWIIFARILLKPTKQKINHFVTNLIWITDYDHFLRSISFFLFHHILPALRPSFGLCLLWFVFDFKCSWLQPRLNRHAGLVSSLAASNLFTQGISSSSAVTSTVKGESLKKPNTSDIPN